MIKVVCFDLDGTLVDSEEVILRSFDKVFEVYIPEQRSKNLKDYRMHLGPILKDTFSKFTNDDELIGDMIELFITYYKEIEKPLIKLYPHVIDTMEYLYNNGYKICLASNKLLSSTTQSIDTLGLRKYFSEIVALDRVGRGKPDPRYMYIIEDAYNVSNDEILMVGDSACDIECARNAGVKNVLCGYNDWAEEVKEETNPDYVIESFDELINIINKINEV